MSQGRMGNKQNKEVCWKCRYLIVSPDGFFKRKTKRGPCDRCLKQMTVFQIAWEKDIWLKFIPLKKKGEQKEKKTQRPSGS